MKLVALWLLCFVGELAVFTLAFTAGYFSDQYRYPRIATIGVLVGIVAGNIALIGSILYYRHKTRHHWVRSEADRWLAQRSRHPVGVYRARVKSIRKLLWLPSVLALTVFLFLPESFGVFLHLFYSGAVDLNHHHLEVPVTWWITNDGRLYLWALAGKGIGRVGPLPYWRREPPISGMLFYAISDPANNHAWDKPPIPGIVLSTRTLVFGTDALTCWELRPFRGLASVRCVSSKNDFTASFLGQEADVRAFYRVLERSTESN
jgi:hypothetical protein